MSVRDTIIEKLSASFAPAHLEVIDESNKHFGHAGWREGGETHFRVRIATRHFDGKARIAQHRDIMSVLDAELKGRVHALAIEVLPPEGPFTLPDRV
ncbi:BolA family protein [Devosia sp.]|uniref:BolA family protein n=1 Tax=Devosia sp. TaxID=1871048 RepID=UPI003262F67E